MMRHIPTDKAILRKWLKAGVVEGRQLFPTDKGTPAGGIISPTLANMVGRLFGRISTVPSMAS
jgi:RNA-directed DNA polymerase